MGYHGDVRLRPVAPVLLAITLAGVGAGCGRTYREGDEVMVEWEGKEYPAVILAAEGPTKFKVHYDGYDDAWDEVVPKARIKSFRTGNEPIPDPPAKVRQKAVPNLLVAVANAQSVTVGG